MDRLHVIYMVAQDLVARALKDVMAGTLVVPGYQEPVAPPPAAPPAPPPPDADDASDAHAETRHVASLLERAERVIVMAGAGLSTAAGIPDFRTPGTGLYYQLEKYELPNPEAVFSIDYFRQRPEAFHMLAHEMWPGKFAPTDAHAFIRLLADKGKLLRCYTQNIDGLERLAGVPAELLMECHGTFATARAIDPPKAAVDIGWYKAQLDAGCTQIRCPETGSLVKPDIVFFGEPLPPSFGPSVKRDFPQADLLIVIGTSLTVMPFAGLVRQVEPAVPRVLINMVAAGTHLLDFSRGRDAGAEPTAELRRDFAQLGDCQASIRRLARMAGWTAELEALVEAQRGRVAHDPPTSATVDALGDSLADRMSTLGV